MLSGECRFDEALSEWPKLEKPNPEMPSIFSKQADEDKKEEALKHIEEHKKVLKSFWSFIDG